MILVLCEIQSTSPKTRPLFTVSIYYDDNHYITVTSDLCNLHSNVGVIIKTSEQNSLNSLKCEDLVSAIFISPCIFCLSLNKSLPFMSEIFRAGIIIIIMIIIIIIIIIYSFTVFHISVSWWFLTGVWVTLSLLKSPGLVSGFWSFLAMLSFGKSLPVRQLPSPPGLLIILSLMCLSYQSQLAQSLLSCSTAFSIL